MSKFEQHNGFINGALAGIIATFPKYIFNELTQVLNFSIYDNNATALGVVLTDFQHDVAHWILGFITAHIIGAFWGIVIAFIFTYLLTEKNYLLKGAMFGGMIWVFNFGFMAKVAFDYPPKLLANLNDVVSMLLSLIIYGVVTVYTLQRLGFFNSFAE